LIAEPALADVGSFVASVFGWLIMQIVSTLGKILTWVIGLLIQIAQYNGFITAPAVSKGWTIMRDVCNMFFIAALLLIAFGTVLKIEKYSYKRTLGGLLIAAVLINFSKFICGFFIDIAQILMLTFVNAFKDAGAGNFLQMLGMDKWLNFSGAQSAAGGSALTGALFALILVVISLIVISIMMVILAFRIVIIWLLVVLSPLVFVLNIFPGKMKSYSNMWWQKFTSQLIVGPVMAFFIWLSFAVVNESSIVPETSVYSSGGFTTEGTVNLSDTSVSEAANPSNFAKFVVSIAMLVGSLLIAQQLGVVGGKLAGKAVGKMQAFASGVVSKPFKAAKKVAKFGVKEAVKETEAATGIPLTKSKWKAIGKEWTKKQDLRREKMATRRKEKGPFAFLPKSNEKWAEILTLKGGPPAIGRWVQGILGVATKKRKEADKQEQELEEMDKEAGLVISETENKKLDTDIKLTKGKINQNEQEEKNFHLDESGEMRLSTVDEFLSILISKRDSLKSSERDKDKAKAKDLTNLINNLEDAKDTAKESDSDTIERDNFNKDSDIQKSYIAEGSEFFKEKGQELKKQSDQLVERKDDIFTEEIQKKIKEIFIGLEIEIDDFNIDPQAKENLKEQVEKLIKDMDGEMSLEKRQQINEEIKHIKGQISQLGKDGKIGEELANSLSRSMEVVGIGLDKKQNIVEDKKIDEMTEARREKRREIRDLRAGAEIIHPQILTHDQRLAMYRGVMSELEKLKGNDDSDELIALYHMAEKTKNMDLAQAVLMKLNMNGDMNDILKAYDLPENYQGEAQFVERLTKRENFGSSIISDQEAYSFVNDLGLQNKGQNRFMFMSPVVRDKKTGAWRPSTEEEHYHITLSESGKVGREKFWRSGSWQGVFGKTGVDSVDGDSVPIASRITMDIIRRDVETINKQIKTGGRLQAELEKNMSHENILNVLKKMKPVDPSEAMELQKLIKRLEIVQHKYWG